MAAYGKMAHDETLEKLAHQIRNRAILQLGRLVKEIKPQPGGDRKSEDFKGDGSGPSDRNAAASKAGVSERQQKTANQVAGLTEN